MPEQASYEYAVVRIVPRVEREEFLNVGVIVYSRVMKFLEAKVELDRQRITATFPSLELLEAERHLAMIPKIAAGAPDAGPIAALPIHERFHWLVAPRSTIIQTSPCHSGLTSNPQEVLQSLFERLVRV